MEGRGSNPWGSLALSSQPWAILILEIPSYTVIIPLWFIHKYFFPCNLPNPAVWLLILKPALRLLVSSKHPLCRIQLLSNSRSEILQWATMLKRKMGKEAVLVTPALVPELILIPTDLENGTLLCLLLGLFWSIEAMKECPSAKGLFHLWQMPTWFGSSRWKWDEKLTQSILYTSAGFCRKLVRLGSSPALQASTFEQLSTRIQARGSFCLCVLLVKGTLGLV